MYRSIATALLALMGFAGSAQAVPVQWTLQDMTYSNGSVATGSFTYDRDTNTFSSISISVTAGITSFYEASTFDAIAPTSGNWFGAIFTTLPLSFDTDPNCVPSSSCGTHGLLIGVNPSEMTNAGGTLAVNNSALMVCSDDICNNGSWQFTWVTQNLTTGSITAVPESDTYAMLLAGLGLVGGVVARRRKQTS